MAKEIKYKIGEISKMYGVSIKSLRYYQQIKLLVPSFVDQFTHYRYYGVEELLKLFYIGQLRNKGFTLLEIRDMFEEGIFTSDIASLENNIQKYEQELVSLKKRLDVMKEILSREKDKEKSEDIYLDTLPSIMIASHMTTLSGYDKLFDYIKNEVGVELMRLGCNFPNPFYCFTREISRDPETGHIEIEYCDEVTEMKSDSDIIRFKRLPEVPLAMCIKVYGTYEKLYEKEEELFAEIAKRGYRIAGDVRFNFVNGGWNIKNPEKWLTIIQVPVEKE